jgi:hypothetical protein
MLAHGDSLLLHERTRDRQTAAERRSPLGSAKDGRTPTSGAYGDPYLKCFEGNFDHDRRV